MEFANCSAMKLTSKEGKPYWFRTCDIGEDIWGGGAHLVSMPSGVRVILADRKIPLAVKHSLMGITYDSKDAWLLDGVNDAGLVGSLLALGEGTSVSAAEPGLEGVCGMELVTRLLAGCASVEEVALAAEGIQVLDIRMGEKRVPCAMHYMFVDKTGACVILEAADRERPGRLTAYRENLGLLTNSPPYPRQLENLSWYLAHAPELNWEGKEPASLTLNGLTVEAAAEAPHFSMSGAFPASYASYDRFIRGAMLMALNEEGRGFPGGSILPLGAQVMASLIEPHNQGVYHYARFDPEKGPEGGHESYTQYLVMYDVTEQVLYLRPYGSTAWTRLVLRKCSQGGIRRHPVCREPMGGVVEAER